MDIGLDSNFDITLDHLNDLKMVTGQEAFEQRLAVRLTSYYSELIGRNLGEDVLSLIELEARRMVADEDGLDTVESVLISRSETDPNTVDVRIIYTTGEDFFTTLSE